MELMFFPMLAGFGLLVALLFALPAGFIAAAKGRSFFGWLVIGLFFPLLGAILALVMPDLEQERSRGHALNRRHRRLGEQLDQERQRNEQHRQQVDGRLDAHDGALGIETRSLASPVAVAELPATPPLPAAQPGEFERFRAATWHISRDHTTSQTLSYEELERRYQTGHITDTSLVWCEGMSDWQSIGDLTELRECLS